MQLLSNNFAEFGNSILNKYNGFGHYYDPLSLIFLQDTEMSEEQPQPVVNQTYLNEIHYLKQENHIYEKNISFLINLMEKNVVQKVTNTVKTQIKNMLAQELPMMQETVVHQISTHIYNELTEISRVDSLQQILEEKVIHYLVDQKIDQSKKLQIARNIVNIVNANGTIPSVNKQMSHHTTFVQENENHQEIMVENYAVIKNQSGITVTNAQVLVTKNEVQNKNHQSIQGITNQFIQRIHAYSHQEMNHVSQNFQGTDRVYLKEQNQENEDVARIESSSTFPNREEKEIKAIVVSETVEPEQIKVSGEVKVETIKEIVNNTMKEISKSISNHNFYLQDRRVIKNQLTNVVEQYLQKQVTGPVFQQLVENEIVTYVHQMEQNIHHKQVYSPMITGLVKQNITMLDQNYRTNQNHFETVKEWVNQHQHQAGKRLTQFIGKEHISYSSTQNYLSEQINQNRYNQDEYKQNILKQEEYQQKIYKQNVYNQDKYNQEIYNQNSYNQEEYKQHINQQMVQHDTNIQVEQFHETIQKQYEHTSPIMEISASAQVKNTEQGISNVYLSEMNQNIDADELEQLNKKNDAKEVKSIITEVVEEQLIKSETNHVHTDRKEVVSIVKDMIKENIEDATTLAKGEDVVITKEVVSMAADIIKKNTPDKLLVKTSDLEKSMISNDTHYNQQMNSMQNEVQSLFQSNYQHTNQSQLTQEFTDNIIHKFTTNIEQINQQYVEQVAGIQSQVNHTAIHPEQIQEYYLSKEYKVEDSENLEAKAVVTNQIVTLVKETMGTMEQVVNSQNFYIHDRKQVKNQLEQIAMQYVAKKITNQEFITKLNQEFNQYQTHLNHVNVQVKQAGQQVKNQYIQANYLQNNVEILEQKQQEQQVSKVLQNITALQNIYLSDQSQQEEDNRFQNKVLAYNKYYKLPTLPSQGKVKSVNAKQMPMALIQFQMEKEGRFSNSKADHPFRYDQIPLVHEVSQREEHQKQTKGEEPTTSVVKQKEVMKDIQFVKEKTTQLVKENKIVKSKNIVQETRELQEKEKEYIVRTVEQTVDESINQLTKQVYRRIEDKLKSERSRRGLL